MSETSGEFGVALGVAALGSLGTVVYRTQLADTIPAGVPVEAATIAGEGITAAMTAAAQLPAALGADLLDGARAAFTAGLNVVFGVGAAVFVGLAILAAALLRHLSPAGRRSRMCSKRRG